MIALPFEVLVRSQTRTVFLDGDILHTVLEQASGARASGSISRERVCSYWSGGARTFPVPIAGGDRCSLFRVKPDGRRLF